ncbi:response regulator transcription factor [Paenibacillus sp. 1P07SE]|uniref:response regulator transcription factor n=1 Tax=Paenibacillus sp. 1P07SE TaxID=3132209 RepID=UPI0039A4DB88
MIINTARILIVEDEDRIRQLLRMYLEKEGFSIVEATDGHSALQMAIECDIDLILLDVMLPGLDGNDVCYRLRQVKRTPVIMLTAKNEEINRIQGFEAGADDYVTKPFSPREVIYRIKAILSRATVTAYQAKLNKDEDNIIFPHLVIDRDAHRVKAEGYEVNLTPMEFDLLHFLARVPNRISTREELMKEVWKYDYIGDPRTVDTHVKRLREKLGRVSPDAAEMIMTVWGVGYKLKLPE